MRADKKRDSTAHAHHAQQAERYRAMAVVARELHDEDSATSYDRRAEAHDQWALSLADTREMPAVMVPLLMLGLFFGACSAPVADVPPQPDAAVVADATPIVAPDTRPATAPDATPIVVPDATPMVVPDTRPAVVADATPMVVPDTRPAVVADTKPAGPYAPPAVAPACDLVVPPSTFVSATCQAQLDTAPDSLTQTDGVGTFCGRGPLTAYAPPGVNTTPCPTGLTCLCAQTDPPPATGTLCICAREVNVFAGFTYPAAIQSMLPTEMAVEAGPEFGDGNGAECAYAIIPSVCAPKI